jgi:hypothetical protein
LRPDRNDGWTFTLPVWGGAFDAFVDGQPFTVITGKISSVGTIYWNIHIENDVDGYAYLLPIVLNFPDEEYELTLLPSTNFVLDVR